jgi:hypothetical protein
VEDTDKLGNGYGNAVLDGKAPEKRIPILWSVTSNGVNENAIH